MHFRFKSQLLNECERTNAFTNLSQNFHAQLLDIKYQNKLYTSHISSSITLMTINLLLTI